MEVRVLPELARLALKSNKEIAFIVWSILRANVTATDHSSHYTKKDVIRLCSSLRFTKRHWSRIFAAGNKIFWGSDGRSLHMRSIKHTRARLEQITGDRVDARLCFQEQVIIALSPTNTAQKYRALLYWSWLYARGEVTISRDSLSDLFGLSHDQQRSYEALLTDQMIVRSNHCHINNASYLDNPIELPAHQYTFGYNRLTASNKVEDVQITAFQLPNTFIARPAGNGQMTTTTASRNAIRQMNTRSWYAKTTCDYNKVYYANLRDFMQTATLDSYVRVGFQFKKQIWQSGQYF